MNQDEANRRESMNLPESRRSRKGSRITVSLSERDHATLTELAERHDVSISWLTRQALVEFIDKHKDTQAQLPLQIRKQ